MKRVRPKKIEVEYNPVYLPYFHDRSRVAILYGGAGSGKSVAAPQKIIMRILSEWHLKHKAVCVRKFASTLRDSTFAQVKEVIDAYGIRSICTVRETSMSVEFENGSIILSRGIDDPEKLKSITKPTMFWLEEASELDEEDFDQVNLRLRGVFGSYYQTTLTFNPISETHWIKSKFFDGSYEGVFRLHTTYKDNLFLDDQYKDELETKFKSDPNLYRIYVKGEWGRLSSGSEFYKNFDYTKHTDNTVFDPELPFHISYDFNVHPYMPMGVFQVKSVGNIWHVKMIDEIVGVNPDNTTERVTDIFMKKWGEHIKSPVFVYGDATGRRKSALAGTVNHFDLIGRGLGRWYTSQSLRILSKNPSLGKRRLFLGKVFNGEYNIDIKIDRKCKKMIDDLEVIKIDINGGKHKPKKKDPVTGIAYESHGHFSDLFDYFMVGCFERLFLDMDI